MTPMPWYKMSAFGSRVCRQAGQIGPGAGYAGMCGAMSVEDILVVSASRVGGCNKPCGHRPESIPLRAHSCLFRPGLRQFLNRPLGECRSMPGPTRVLGRSSARPPSALSPSMADLSPLVGSWDVRIRWSEEAHQLVGGPPEVETKARISWLDKGGILHFQIGPSHWLIGRDEVDKEYTALYTDERRVSRVYHMSFRRGVWKIWRNAPGFRQRFEGRLRSDGRRIVARWEKAEGNKPWALDFDMVFRR
jgi:hypothetical protein